MNRKHVIPGWLATAMLFSLPGAAQAVEEPDYDLLRRDVDFELRSYGATLVAETVVSGAFEEAGSRAFRALLIIMVRLCGEQYVQIEMLDIYGMHGFYYPAYFLIDSAFCSVGILIPLSG